MDKPFKVLLLSPPPEASGGIASWTKHILNYYNIIEKNQKSKFEFFFFPMGRSKFITASMSGISRAINGVMDYYSVVLNYRRVIGKDKPSVVHISSSASLGLFKDIVLEKINHRRGIKTIIHFHFGRIPELAQKRNWEWKILKHVMSYADKVIVIDMMSFRTLRDLNFSNTYLLPNPISPDILSLINYNDNIARISRKIVFAGHIVPTKGIFELLDACVQIPNIQLVMLGRLVPSIKERMLAIANKKGNTDWITIRGEQKSEDVIKEMLSCSVFVLPTHTEGFPNVILESMACSCAIVTTPVGAIPEMLDIVADNPCGTCVRIKDVSALKTAIEIYLNDAELAQKHGEAAQRRVNAEYSMSSVWRQLENIWLDVK